MAKNTKLLTEETFDWEKDYPEILYYIDKKRLREFLQKGIELDTVQIVQDKHVAALQQYGAGKDWADWLGRMASWECEKYGKEYSPTDILCYAMHDVMQELVLVGLNLYNL
jgi:hypothetical protein